MTLLTAYILNVIVTIALGLYIVVKDKLTINIGEALFFLLFALLPVVGTIMLLLHAFEDNIIDFLNKTLIDFS